MSDEKLKQKPIEIPSGEIERMFRRLFDEQMKEGLLKKGDSSFLKKTSMIDKSLDDTNELDDLVFKMMERTRNNPRIKIVSDPVGSDELNQISIKLFQKPLEYLTDQEREVLEEYNQNQLKSGGAVTRVRLESGGDPYLDIDKEIALLEGMVGLQGTNSMEAFWIEGMKDRLDYLKKLAKEDKK